MATAVDTKKAIEMALALLGECADEIAPHVSGGPDQVNAVCDALTDALASL